jgi:hypothetical protein
MLQFFFKRLIKLRHENLAMLPTRNFERSLGYPANKPKPKKLKQTSLKKAFCGISPLTFYFIAFFSLLQLDKLAGGTIRVTR